MQVIKSAIMHLKYIFNFFKERNVIFMIEWFAARVAYGHMTAEKGKETPERPLVPKALRDKVIKVLKQMGLNAHGEPIESSGE